MRMQELQLRPYHDLSGAIFRAEAGWSIPAGADYLEVEGRAILPRAGMIDLSDRAKIELAGSERVPFLDGLVTTDLKIIGPGMSTYALLLNEKSRVLGDLRVYALADSLVLDIDASQKDSIVRLLEKARVSDDVEFRDLGLCGHIEVHGPSAGEAVSAIVGTDVRSLSDNAFLTFSVDRHHDGRAMRLRAFGEDGYAIWSAGARLAEAWEALVRRGVTPGGRDAAEVRRIESRVPWLGADMGEDTLALEVAPESAISYTKGCYVGQETVARGTYVGQVRRKLLGLRIEEEMPTVHCGPASWGEQVDGAVTVAGRYQEVGRGVT